MTSASEQNNGVPPLSSMRELQTRLEDIENALEPLSDAVQTLIDLGLQGQIDQLNDRNKALEEDLLKLRRFSVRDAIASHANIAINHLRKVAIAENDKTEIANSCAEFLERRYIRDKTRMEQATNPELMLEEFRATVKETLDPHGFYPYVAE